MEKGDRFIFYGKSSVVKGVVMDRYEKATYDVKHGVRVIHRYIVSDKGETYYENSCLKIESDIGPHILRKLIDLFT